MAVRDVATRIRVRFKRLGLSATAEQYAQLEAYFGLLAKWNKTVNLTAVVLDPPSDQAIDRLLVEPFIAARHLKGASGLLLDLGSGGGSPAIPLKIAVPNLRLVMIESKARKSAFLREALRQIPLTDAEVLNGRIEEAISRPDLHQAAGIVSIRAVRADRSLWNSVSAFVSPGGCVLWFRAVTEGKTSDAYFPPFVLEAVERFAPEANGELAILRLPV